MVPLLPWSIRGSRRETERLPAGIRDSRAARQRPAVPTVVRVSGSAPPRSHWHPPSRQDGSRVPTFGSAGSLPSLTRLRVIGYRGAGRRATAWRKIRSQVGIGCSGAADIGIERFEADALTGAWLDILRDGRAGVLVTPLAGAPGRLPVSDDGAPEGTLGDPISTPPRRRWRWTGSGRPTRIPVPALGHAELFFELSCRRRSWSCSEPARIRRHS